MPVDVLVEHVRAVVHRHVQVGQPVPGEAREHRCERINRNPTQADLVSDVLKVVVAQVPVEDVVVTELALRFRVGW